jgi:methylphosphotriester-DNA--protein-cysteine methyltransferase
LKVSVKEAKSAFGSRFGLDISDYITRRRVDEGLQLVRSGVSVEAAAMNVGYKSKRHFYSAVRKLTGTTRRGSEIDGHRHRCRGGANVGQIRHELKN